MDSHPPQAPPAFHIMTKPHGAICNLDCHYCFFLKKERLYPDSDFRMSPEVLEDYTRQTIAAQQVPEVTFAWQGGEPTLMGVDFFRQAVALQAKYCKPGMRIHNAFQTNGVLLDDEWCAFFKAHGFLIGISIDGPRELHDTYRQDKGGRPTFDRVMRGLDYLQKHKVEYNVLTCVNAVNAEHPLEAYRLFLAATLFHRRNTQQHAFPTWPETQLGRVERFTGISTDKDQGLVDIARPGKGPEQRFVTPPTGLVDQQELDYRLGGQPGRLGEDLDSFFFLVRDDPGQDKRVGVVLVAYPVFLESVFCLVGIGGALAITGG